MAKDVTRAQVLQSSEPMHSVEHHLIFPVDDNRVALKTIGSDLVGEARGEAGNRLFVREDRTDWSQVELNKLASYSQRLLHGLRFWCYYLFLLFACLQRFCDVSRDVIPQRLRSNNRQLRKSLLILLEIHAESVRVPLKEGL